MRKNKAKIKDDSKAKAYRRKLSIRKKITGTAERPRLCVIKSNKHLQVQVVNDETQKTILAIQTFGKNAVAKGANKESAKVVGLKLAEKLKEQNITKAVFDRNGKIYTGVIAAVADSARENGIQI